MKLGANPGMLLLSVWLILTGLAPLAKVDLNAFGPVLPILAIAAGVLLLRTK